MSWEYRGDHCKKVVDRVPKSNADVDWEREGDVVVGV
jgi:hypothetical protein